MNDLTSNVLGLLIFLFILALALAGWKILALAHAWLDVLGARAAAQKAEAEARRRDAERRMDKKS